MSYITNSFDEKVVELLKNGAVGFMPSDTVYGLSARALDQLAVEHIYQLKQRDDNKPCIILLADIGQAEQIGIKPGDLNLVKDIWPAPLTFITPARTTPEYLHRGLESLAIRIPANDALREMISVVGPIVSTSANIQDEPVAHTAKKAQRIFGDRLDFYVDNGELSAQPSTIAEMKNGRLEIVRHGAWKIPPQHL